MKRWEGENLSAWPSVIWRTNFANLTRFQSASYIPIVHINEKPDKYSSLCWVDEMMLLFMKGHLATHRLQYLQHHCLCLLKKNQFHPLQSPIRKPYGFSVLLFWSNVHFDGFYSFSFAVLIKHPLRWFFMFPAELAAAFADEMQVCKTIAGPEHLS